MGGPVNIFLIEDHRLSGEGLAQLFGMQEEYVFLGAIDSKGALEQVRYLPVEIVLMSSTIGRSEIIRLLLEIKKELPKVHIMILGLENEEEMIMEYIEAGVAGYLFKEASFGELLQAVKATHSGQTLCCPRIAAKVFDRITKLSAEVGQAVGNFNDRLSLREQEVLRLIAAGLSNKEIANRLFISLPTVKNHVHNILTKLQVNCRREAIRSAHENKFLIGPAQKSPFSRARSFSDRADHKIYRDESTI